MVSAATPDKKLAAADVADPQIVERELGGLAFSRVITDNAMSLVRAAHSAINRMQSAPAARASIT